MEKLINLDEYPVLPVLDILLQDKTTKENIIWATRSYIDQGEQYSDKYVITKKAIRGERSILIQPRVFKAAEAQAERTKKKAEVFTPSWIVNKMNNALDEEWFGQKDIFNIEEEQSWTVNDQPLPFGKGKTFHSYIYRRGLEITCGEAPFIVSRYDVATGNLIPIENRIGILDRKLRAINENIDDEDKWIKMVKAAYKSVYGYEFQGDNLLIARINLLLTFVDYYQDRWNKQPNEKLLAEIAKIISWNFWQMDGLQGSVPMGVPEKEAEQLSLFEFEEEKKAPLCRIMNWSRTNSSALFSQAGKEEKMKKWDVIIGNPPYQDEAAGENKTFASPVYNLFLDAAHKISTESILIHPARFLFNMGSTPKEWNQNMLNNEHLKVNEYFQKSSSVFPNTDIKGGIAITYFNRNRQLGPISVFSPFPPLMSILKKVKEVEGIDYSDNNSLMNVVYQQNRFNLDILYADHPDYRYIIGSSGKDKRLRNNIFSKLPEVFTDSPQNDEDIKILGLIKNKRVWKFIKRKYISFEHENLDKYKVLVPAANGSGAIGEVLSTPIIGDHLLGYTQSFIGIGAFNSKAEAENLNKYLKCKFSRTMLGILKVTQHNDKGVWKYVPLQNFSSNSDIDWTKSIPEIDQQLYKKYNLSPEEIEFIETQVKEME